MAFVAPLNYFYHFFFAVLYLYMNFPNPPTTDRDLGGTQITEGDIGVLAKLTFLTHVYGHQ